MALRRGKKHYTADRFEKIALRAQNDDRRLELENGTIVEIGSSPFYNSITGGYIASAIVGFDMDCTLGFGLTAKALYKLAPDCVRSPNVSFVTRAHAPTLDDLEKVTFPDLAVEVAMPDEDVLKRAREYLDAGTRIVWIVYTDTKTIEVVTPGERDEMRVRRLTSEDTLDGGDVLPGFSLLIEKVFPKVD